MPDYSAVHEAHNQPKAKRLVYARENAIKSVKSLFACT
jgi:hypothetical protein